MKRWLLGAALALLAGPALAAPCGGYLYTLTNGTLADANQVMSNFNTVMSCLQNNAAASGANIDITSLSGMTTPLSQAQGGTGGTTAVNSFNTRSGSVTLSGADVNTALGYTAAGLGVSNVFTQPQFVTSNLDVQTISGPNYGLRIRGIASGYAILQFDDPTGTTQWADLATNSSGVPTWSGVNLVLTTDPRLSVSPKAYANVTCTSGGCTVNASYGVASVTRAGVGSYVVAFSTLAADTFYAVNCNTENSASYCNAWVKTTSGFTINLSVGTDTAWDIVVYGN